MAYRCGVRIPALTLFPFSAMLPSLDRPGSGNGKSLNFEMP